MDERMKTVLERAREHCADKKGPYDATDAALDVGELMFEGYVKPWLGPPADADVVVHLGGLQHDLFFRLTAMGRGEKVKTAEQELLELAARLRCRRRR